MDRFRILMKVVLKMLLSGAAVFVAVLVNKFLLFPGLDAIFGFSDTVVPFIKVAGALVLMALAYGAVVKFYEKRPVTELGFHGRNMVYGALSGALLISITTFILFFLGNYEFIAYRGFATVMVVVCPVLAVSIFEEFLFRGVLFRIIEQHIGTLYSLIAVSVLFSALHMANEGANVMVFVSATLISVLWCGVYVVARNIWVAGLHHAAWNLAVFSSGIPVSGMIDWTKHAPLESSYQGPVWLTGGTFGPEGSIITVIVGVISLTLLLHWAWQHDRFVGTRVKKPDLAIPSTMIKLN